MKKDGWTESYFTENATVWAILTLIMDIVMARLLRFSSLKVIKISIGTSEESAEPIAIAERRVTGWKLKSKN
ncbi:MAG TPA: hypothetical protein VMW46_12110 [Candidatus Desulfaltia sp.]|nr:hypothetical protein [Candidatus Desulfaltia sp.]